MQLNKTHLSCIYNRDNLALVPSESVNIAPRQNGRLSQLPSLMDPTCRQTAALDTAATRIQWNAQKEKNMLHRNT